ncbi:hypothetical protein [Microbacterium sp. P03]|uniref:hypothetical protein n=1 Tax=Microbacterium sp. P03 TaxID=3366946 RepID=UPI003747240F
MLPETADADTDGLLRGYRTIRDVDRPDTPWPGMLTRMPGGQMCVLVDADVLGPLWRGWDARAHGHLLAPIDVLRRADGHDVALPVCTETVETFLRRRTAIGAPLSDGEAVTLAVSLMRGASEWVERTPRDPLAGEWWLIDGGRPMFAAGAGRTGTDTVGDRDRASADSSTMRLCTLITDEASSSLRPVFAAAAELLAEPRRLLRSIEQWETRAFAAAAPLPLATAILAPVLSRPISPSSPTADDDDMAAVKEGGVLALIARHVDADLADTASRMTMRIWRRLRSKSAGPIRRPWVMAAVSAAVVICVGVMWPAGDTAPASAGAASQSASTATPTPTAGPLAAGEEQPTTADSAPPPPDVGAEQWVSTAGELLTVRAGCGDDPACLSEVMEDPWEVHPKGAADLPAASHVVTLLDEFGGAAVLRVDARDSSVASQLVIVVRLDDRFLLRDIHDVAKQEG